ncbi:hypothetical protein DFH08DRAFT_930451 [Mycena albidolilacea]|uniref:Uncharacterized protein n=1 Tax=Mycena albidolilacea TaxID=1033008 RepID=A0AAD7F1U5_9AGAR|nr:hypothetical protein DFH08DRAFT_930451 [Mycena albidolilacea]
MTIADAEKSDRSLVAKCSKRGCETHWLTVPPLLYRLAGCVITKELDLRGMQWTWVEYKVSKTGLDSKSSLNPDIRPGIRGGNFLPYMEGGGGRGGLLEVEKNFPTLYPFFGSRFPLEKQRLIGSTRECFLEIEGWTRVYPRVPSGVPVPGPAKTVPVHGSGLKPYGLPAGPRCTRGSGIPAKIPA